jgi:hypothetical protein
MQQRWDNIDKLIIASEERIEVGDDYNQRLLIKVKNRKRKENKQSIAAFSLIATGIFAITLYTSDIQYKLIELEVRTKNHIIAMQQDKNVEILVRSLRGE